MESLKGFVGALAQGTRECSKYVDDTMIHHPLAGILGAMVALVVAVTLMASGDETEESKAKREEKKRRKDQQRREEAAKRGEVVEPPREVAESARPGEAAGRASGQESLRLRETHRSRRVLLAVFGAFTVCLLELICFVPHRQLWLWFLSIFPATLVVHHGIQLAVFKNRRFFDGSQEPYLPHADPSILPIVRAAMKEERRYYGTASLLLRFALPALVLIFTNLAIGYTLIDPPRWGAYALNDQFATGAQVAVLGAYVYVLLLLGGRTIRGDITPSSVWWSTVTMTAGTLLGGILSVMFVGDDLQKLSEGGTKAVGVTAWSTLLLPFAAGFSLRYIVSFLNETIRRVIGGRAIVGPRTVPLTQLRGIDQDIEERLAEEGIIDVSGLSMANPTKLRRNTRFDKRQILSWIDEALLITYLPTSWQSLESEGITGAIDLIWYACFLDRKDLCPPADQPLSETKTCQLSKIAGLATRNKLSVDSLQEAILRMKEDAQISLIRGLYQLDDTESEEVDESRVRFERFRAEFREDAKPALKPSGAAASEGIEKNAEGAVVAARTRGSLGADGDAPDAPNEMDAARARLLEQNEHGFFLVHKWRRSRLDGYEADLVISLRRDGTEARPPVGSAAAEKPAKPPQISSVEYWLGPAISAATIVKTNALDGFRVNVSLKRPKLCVAKVTFADGSPDLWLERYLDFDVGADA